MSKIWSAVFLLNLDHFENFSDGNFFNRLGFVIHKCAGAAQFAVRLVRNIKAHYDVGI